jgi:hypothetical protein
MPDDKKRLVRENEAAAEVQQINRMARELSQGRVVLCETCRQPLALRLPGSGYHPGIFCPMGCTSVLTEAHFLPE